MNSNAFDLLHFCKKNPAPAVSFQPSGYFLSCYTVFLRITLYNLLQANDNFWKIQYDHEAAKKARAAKRDERKTTKPTTSRKRKPSASELFQLDDTDDNEEEVTFEFPFLLYFYLTDANLLSGRHGQQPTHRGRGNCNLLRLRASAALENSKSNPESKIFTSFGLPRS